MRRAKRLLYKGKPGEFMAVVPPRDLTEDDISGLSDADYRYITAEHPTTGKALYVADDAPRAPRRKKADDAPQDAPDAEAAPA